MSARKPRPLYSQRFLATYGRELKRDEIRLVQGYRGLPDHTQERVRTLMAALVLERLQREETTGGAR